MAKLKLLTVALLLAAYHWGAHFVGSTFLNLDPETNVIYVTVVLGIGYFWYRKKFG